MTAPDHHHDTVPAPPLVSADGRFWFDGERWTPFPARPLDSHTLARGVSAGIGDVILRVLLVVLLAPLALLGVALVVTVASSSAVASVAAVALATVLVGGAAWWRWDRRAR